MFNWAMTAATFLVILLGVHTAALASTRETEINKEKLDAVISSLKWYGQSAFSISGDVTDGHVIYIDPVGSKLKTSLKADVILVTHTHGDHFSPSDINKVIKDDTKTMLIGSVGVSHKTSVSVMKPGDCTVVCDIPIEAVPAYNTNKAYHPKEAEFIGYILTLKNGVRVYHAGDTDRISEMKSFDADIVLVPIGGKYTMTWSEAVDAVKDIQPKVAIPMHYGSVVGTVKDAESFKKALSGYTEVIIMTVEK